MNIQSPRLRLVALMLWGTYAIGFCSSIITTAYAQAGKPTTSSMETKAAFRIEPIVQRFKAKRGEVIPFSFEVTASKSEMEIEIAPTSMRQEETGLILPSGGAAAEDGLRLLSPREFKLKPGESHKIKGEVHVPLAKSNFLSFGILVKDRGQLDAHRNDLARPGETKAAIRFVTQYLLRIDIDTGVKDFTDLQQVTLEQCEIRAENGQPVAQVYLNNPTNFAFECLVQGAIESSQTRHPQPFYLGLPCRKELAIDQRTLVRVLPHSRVRLEAGIDSMLFPGHQQLKVKVSSGSHPFKEQSFDFDVDRGQFGGLETKLAFVGNQLSVEPAQIELSMVGRSPRTRMMVFHNNSDTIQSVSLSTQTLRGEPMSGLKLSSDAFEIKPGRAKSIRLIIENNQTGMSSYGQLLVRLSDSRGGPELTEALPLALLYSEPAVPKVEVGDLLTIASEGQTRFELAVTNQSERYAPVHAHLNVISRKGRSFSLDDGFGRWLAPGETRVLRFIPVKPLEADDYQMSIEVETVKGAEPLRKTKIITIAPPVDPSISSTQSEATAKDAVER